MRALRAPRYGPDERRRRLSSPLCAAGRRGFLFECVRLPFIGARHGGQAGCTLAVPGGIGPAAAHQRFHAQGLSLPNSVVVHGGAPTHQITLQLAAVRTENASIAGVLTRA
ncbi:hypothetical protein BOSE127_100236 [Bosea sp. 127]|nr:hypothetical protein BOSE7B_50566 [Bosea sp. 7B]VXB09526.1 hypothetical protein BOSE127_100236 [Bosea sp. 127]